MDKSRLWPFYVYSFLVYMLPLYAVYILMVNSVLGDPVKTASLLAVWSGTVVLLEVPSGALADLWSRKGMVLVSQVCGLASAIIWFLARDYFLLLGAFVFWGVSESFLSGAFQALLYEELEHHGQEDHYEKVSGRIMALMTTGAAAAVLVGGLLKDRYPQIVYLASIAVAGIALLIAFVLPADKERKSPEMHYRDVFKEALSILGKSRILLRLLMFSMLFIAVIGTIEEFVQLWLAELHVKSLLYATMLFLVMMLQAVGAGAASLIILKKRKEVFLYSGMAVSGVLLIASRFIPSLSLPLVCLVFFITGMLESKLESALQETVSGQRATLLSFSSLSVNGCAILFAMGIGSAGGRTSFATAFALFGGLVLVGAVLLAGMKCRDKDV